jgi:hypothetical protein
MASFSGTIFDTQIRRIRDMAGNSPRLALSIEAMKDVATNLLDLDLRTTGLLDWH